ncbi:MAG TPA: flagellar biosynthesis protein FliO, partial [Anaerolineae bacterium]|nr:flagellar biosynthesis protein FliO [Anaerolineae bacterium]
MPTAQPAPTAMATASPLPPAAPSAAAAPSPTVAAPRLPTICPDLPGRFEVLGVAGGLLGPVAVQGRYACLSAGPRLVV